MPADHSDRSRRFREALEDALADQQSPVAPALLLSRLGASVRRCRHLDLQDAAIEDALEALAAIVATQDGDAALSEAAARFESPQRFRETLFFVRCLERDPTTAGPIMQGRAYLGAATVQSAAFPSLAADQTALLESTTFEALWQDPDRFRQMRDGLGAWQQSYVPAYLARHTTYHAALAGLTEELESTQWQADLLQKLNSLAGLGRPMGLAWLARFQDLERLFRCPARTEELREALGEQPLCPHCEYRLTDETPAADAERTFEGLREALQTQAGRLEHRVVGRLLATGGTPERRLQTFIDAVQSADHHALFQLLDEGLLEFLGDLLNTPDGRPGLLAQLASAYPEVTDDNVEEVAAAFEQLLRAEIARNGGRLSLETGDA